MGDTSRDTAIPANTAIVPVPKLENDTYDWYARHAAVLRAKDEIKPEIVLIGDSITHFWGGEPKARQANGPKAFASVFAPYRVLNLGFGWDRTQNVLWRLDRGEIDGLHPRTVVIHIGTNNTSQTEHARQNTPAEIVEGIAAICGRVRSKAPGVRIILMQVMPREEKPDHPRRAQIAAINRLLVEFAQANHLDLLDLAPKLLKPDGTLPKSLMPDFCHPNEKGYMIWADALRPLLGPGKKDVGEFGGTLNTESGRLKVSRGFRFNIARRGRWWLRLGHSRWPRNRGWGHPWTKREWRGSEFYGRAERFDTRLAGLSVIERRFITASPGFLVGLTVIVTVPGWSMRMAPSLASL